MIRKELPLGLALLTAALSVGCSDRDPMYGFRGQLGESYQYGDFSGRDKIAVYKKGLKTIVDVKVPGGDTATYTCKNKDGRLVVKSVKTNVQGRDGEFGCGFFASTPEKEICVRGQEVVNRNITDILEMKRKPVYQDHNKAGKVRSLYGETRNR